MYRYFIFLICLAFAFSAYCEELEPAAPSQPEAPAKKSAQPALRVVHSKKGDKSDGVAGHLQMVNIGKRQQYSAAEKESWDRDISSPKSVNVSPDGKILFVNSLEGCRTVAYDIPSLEKRYTVEYKFDSGKGPLWAPPSGYYQFTHYKDGENRSFSGKPVESALSHGGKYLWVPFYRRTFDINAQDPSAIAVVETATGRIVRMFETGPLPKAVAVNPENTLVAVTHWGNNTVGFIAISDADMNRWHHLSPITIGRKLDLNYSLTEPVNRDSNSGYLLRGTVFTPDGRYLFVSGLAGPMGVIDVKEHKLVGTVAELHGIRHLAISGDNVYGSMNVQGVALKFPLSGMIAGIEDVKSGKASALRVKGEVKRVKVGGGARTLEVSPDGKYLFVACNSASAIYVVDTETMKVVDTIRCDSFPVGLALTPSGRYMAVTSQGRAEAGGGNAMNLFEIIRPDLPEGEFIIETSAEDTMKSDTLLSGDSEQGENSETNHTPLIFGLIFAVAIIATIAAAIAVTKSKK